MATRQRQKTAVVGGTRKHRATGVIDSQSYLSQDDWVEDWVGKGDNFNFTVEKISRTGGLINGTQPSAQTGYIWTNWPATYYRGDPWPVSHLTVPNVPSAGQLAASALARTNPSRSSMEAMEHIGELLSVGPLLKDEFSKRLNKMLKKVPKFKSLQHLAKMHLMTQFGIVPLLSDVETLMQFQQLVDDRVGEIERLRTRGLRRTVALWEGTSSGTVNGQLVQSQGASGLSVNLAKLTKVEITGHVRWYANSNWLKSDATVRNVVKRTIAGYRMDPAAVYELLPWSWLIDYFFNLGTLVKATRNNFDASHDQVRLITRTSTVTTGSWDDANSGTIQVSPFIGTRTSIWRRPATPSLSAQIGFLDGRQLSILGAVSVLKLMR